MEPKKTILVAEDDKFLANIYRLNLSQAGYNVINAMDGQETLVQIQKTKPDLIILDLMMPIKDGFQVLLEIKKDTALKNIPVIVASNLAQPEDVKKAMSLGATDYFIKSNVKISDIIAIVSKHLLPPPKSSVN